MSNPVRACMSCGQEDDHPRCSHQVPDGRWADYHYDCCALLGCDVASALIKGLKKGSVGEDMRVHVIATAALSPASNEKAL